MNGGKKRRGKGARAGEDGSVAGEPTPEQVNGAAGGIANGEATRARAEAGLIAVRGVNGWLLRYSYIMERFARGLAEHEIRAEIKELWKIGRCQADRCIARASEHMAKQRLKDIESRRDQYRLMGLRTYRDADSSTAEVRALEFLTKLDGVVDDKPATSPALPTAHSPTSPLAAIETRAAELLALDQAQGGK